MKKYIEFFLYIILFWCVVCTAIFFNIMQIREIYNVWFIRWVLLVGSSFFLMLKMEEIINKEARNITAKFIVSLVSSMGFMCFWPYNIIPDEVFSILPAIIQNILCVILVIIISIIKKIEESEESEEKKSIKSEEKKSIKSEEKKSK